MPQCSVIGCGQKRTSANKISMHKLPKNEKKKKKWLENLDVENISISKDVYVCSLHFDKSAYSKSNGNVLNEDAVPFKILMVCRMCLATGVKLFNIKKRNLEQAYKLLTGIMPFNETLPQLLCVECTQRLINYNKLRENSLKAHSLLLELLQMDTVISMETLLFLYRQQNNLNSSLNTKTFETDHCDLQIHEYKQTIQEIDVKSEEEDVLETDIANDYSTDDNMPLVTTKKIKKFMDSEENVMEPKIDDDLNVNTIETDHCYGQTDILTEKEEIVKMEDEVFVDTDDSLPLVPIKRGRKVKKKVKAMEPKIDRRRKPFLNGNLKESLFTITDLTLDEQMAEIDKRKESSNYKNSLFKCKECFKGFLDEEAYNSHILRHTNKCGEYECYICKIHFKHPTAQRKHITAHHTQRFNCNQCPYETTHRQTARLHERWHKGTQYQCPHCNDVFVKFSTYMGHIRIKHPSDFVCALCGYSFVSEKGIDLHKKLKHRLDDKLIPEDGPLCEPCNVRFQSEDAYQQHLHVSARHNNRDNESKDRRRRRTREPQEDNDKRKNYPQRFQKVEGPIPCEQCGQQLKDSRAYHSHFRRVHPDKNRTIYPSMKSPCMCEVCGKMFQSYALLKDHRWVHTGERPFACEACGKAFGMRQRLVAHRHVHSELRASYRCALCDKTFSSQSNRQRHMVVHTGLKPFKCEMCGKCFKHVSEKRAHVTYVHLKKPWPKRARAKRRDAPVLTQTISDIEGTASDAHMDTWPEHKQVIYHLKM